MNTLWTDLVDKQLPLNEYPRPQMVRDNWLCLNGEWDFTFSFLSELTPEFHEKITVPFSPETVLSGIGRAPKEAEYLWYRKTVRLPENFNGRRALLHFGAVDCETMVMAGDKPIVFHRGGYLPFTCEVTDYIKNSELSIIVRVLDESDKAPYSRGKQSSQRGGIWYTPQSGIWQTVWMEAVPEDYIEEVKIRPDYDNRCVEISASNSGNGDVFAEFNGIRYKLPTVIPAEKCDDWTPDDPKLYDLNVICGDDKVKTYFALRKFSVNCDEKGIKRLFLNNKPLFHNGLLDQGYWPDGMYTAPSDEAMIFDISTAKKMGFNVLRKHIKVEPLRWYYHCDRLGMIVWQDMPNGGGIYKPAVITLPLFTNIHLKDSAYRLFARNNKSGRAEYYESLCKMVRHLYNCPCIALWVPFNEGWGQFDADKACELIRAIDPDRIIDHASGWHDQGIGKLKSWHVYFRKYRFSHDKLGRAVILSEFGGFNYKVPGHTFNNINFGYRHYKSPESLMYALKELYSSQIAPAKEKGLAAAIYTQLSDVEDELNGLITYDRKVIKIAPDTIRDIVNI